MSGSPASLASLDWATIGAQLGSHGCEVIGTALTPEQCELLPALYETVGHFRSRFVMAPHAYGCGEYQYFTPVSRNRRVRDRYLEVESDSHV